MGEEDYIPWPAELLPAHVAWLDGGAPHDRFAEAWLHFIAPDGQRAAIPVTPGNAESKANQPVWHIDVDEANQRVTVSPSIHLQGYWHSGNPVTFELVDELPSPNA